MCSDGPTGWFFFGRIQKQTHCFELWGRAIGAGDRTGGKERVCKGYSTKRQISAGVTLRHADTERQESCRRRSWQDNLLACGGKAGVLKLQFDEEQV